MTDVRVSSTNTSFGGTSLSRNSDDLLQLRGIDPLGPDFSRLSIATSAAEEYFPQYDEHANRFFKKAKFPKYYSESARLASFSSWHFKHQTPKELARAGFFSTGEEDEVYCFYCGGRLYEWAPTALPWEEHALYFPRCEWLLQQKGKYFVEQIQSEQKDSSKGKEQQCQNMTLSKHVMTSSPCNKIDMSILENRIRSFEGHQWRLRSTVAEFAAAGFFYLRTRNTIKCFMCHIELNEWRDGRSLYEMHQKNSPTCKLFSRSNSNDDEETKVPYSNYRQKLSLKNSNGNAAEAAHKNDDALSIKDFKNEFDRLLSFYHWPISLVVDRCDLASAGFYWKNELVSITVQCFACFGEIKEWKMGERPEGKHKLFFPSCPFVNGKETGNRKITPEERNFAFRIFWERDALNDYQERSYYVCPQPSTYNSYFENSKQSQHNSSEDPLYKCAKHPKFYFETERLKSYTSWPSHHCVSVTTLAAAGFFSNNIKDQVTCFFCGGKLHQWETNDVPWEEHARNFPNCKWVLEKKGKQFVDDIQWKYKTSMKPSTQESPVAAASARPKLGRGEVLPINKHSEKKNTAEKDISNFLQSDAVQVLVDMGFDINVITTVIQKRLDQGLRPYQDAEDLLSAVFAEDDSGRAKHTDQDQVIALQKQHGVPHNHKEDILTSVKETETEDIQNELALLSQKLERLEEKNLCKICVDGEVDVLFLPCKHLVVCKDCSEKLNECPICRSYIDEKVNVFMP